MRRISRPSVCRRRGAILVLAAVMLIMILAFVALSVDIGYIALSKSELQNAADSAAHAAVQELAKAKSIIQAPSKQAEAVRDSAKYFAELNCPDQGNVLVNKDTVIGRWDFESRTFAETNMDPNAVQVTVWRSASHGNALPLFFAPAIGRDSVEVSATAIAALPAPDPAGSFRFLIDEEMFDTDEPSIEILARALKTTPDALLRDNDRDGFIDLPPDVVLELPTGQAGDEALFDTESYSSAFPFQENSRFTSLDFLAEGTALEQSIPTRNLQDVIWPSGEAPHPELIGKKVLDPVPGTDPISKHSKIMNLPDPQMVHVSPVYKSDVSMQEKDPKKYGSPTANLQGERRGLVSFLVLSARPHPAGGSYLPLLTIRIKNPDEIDLKKLTGASGGGSGSSGSTPKIVR